MTADEWANTGLELMNWDETTGDLLNYNSDLGCTDVADGVECSYKLCSCDGQNTFAMQMPKQGTYLGATWQSTVY